jgi:hypothetical protein
MADLNALIAQGYQFQPPPDPFAQYAKQQQLQQGEQANQLNQMKMQEYQRGMDETNAMRRLDPTSATYLQDITRINPEKGFAFAKLRQEAETARTEGQSKNTKLIADKLALLPEAYRMADTPEAYLALHQSVHADPVLGPYLKNVGATPEKGLATLQKAVETGKFDELRMGSMQSVNQILESMKPQVVAPSASVYQGGKFTQAPAAPAAVAAPPAMVAEYTFAKTPDGGNFKGSYQDFVTARAAAGRAPAQPVAPTIAQIVDPANSNQMITIDARRYQGGGAGSPGVIGVAGKEPSAALRTNKVEAGKTQLADDLDNLRASFQTLDQMRAIPSTERGVVSNIGSATAASGMGQILGRATGTEAQVERDVINSARQRLANSIKNAAGMSQQQLNSNMELQTMLRSISDPGQSVQAAMRIIDDIEAAYVTGNGTLPKRNMPSAVSGKVVPAAAAPNLDALLNKYK